MGKGWAGHCHKAINWQANGLPKLSHGGYWAGGAGGTCRAGAHSPPPLPQNPTQGGSGQWVGAGLPSKQRGLGLPAWASSGVGGWAGLACLGPPPPPPVPVRLTAWHGAGHWGSSAVTQGQLSASLLAGPGAWGLCPPR